MIDRDRVVQSLWIGPRLSTMERLSIVSFLSQGHDFHLYAYDHVENVPAGVTIWDGNEILPSSRIFRYTGSGSFAGFANFFRYKLLLDHGGWWVDLDTVCLRPFNFEDEHVLASEFHEGREVLANAVIRAPRGSALAAYAWDVCQTKDPSKLAWGETGPKLVGEAVERLGYQKCVRSAPTFCPVPYCDWESVMSLECPFDFGTETYSVHLWHEMWRHYGLDPDATYDSTCLFERLKSRYLLL